MYWTTKIDLQTNQSLYLHYHDCLINTGMMWDEWDPFFFLMNIQGMLISLRVSQHNDILVCLAMVS